MGVFLSVFVSVNAVSLGSLGYGGLWEGGTQTCPQPAGLGSALPVSIQLECQGRKMWTNMDSPARWLVWHDKDYDECKIFE